MCELFRVKQRFKRGAIKVRLFRSDIQNRATLLVGFFGNISRFEITNDRIQGGDENRVFSQGFFQIVMTNFKGCDGFIGERMAGICQ
ncbi:Uncharacterised protein [Vibrio cholerae]|nr:Uncharacterised protein [Vibrio cholerae]